MPVLVGREAALGSNTKFAASPVNTGLQELSLKRQDRYRLLDTAQNYAPAKHRVRVCQKAALNHDSGTSNFGIAKNEAGQSHFYGLATCSNVWACPVCSQRIAVQRKNEIVAGMLQHHKNGGICILVTFTFAHSKDESLKESLSGMSAALRRFKSLRCVKEARKSLDYIGQIKATETTHSEVNGWHPHSHEIWFLDRSDVTEYELSLMKSKIFESWRESCRKYGLSDPDYTHGLDIAYKAGNSTAVGAYVAKWGMELTYAQRKSGKNESRNPWQMLDDLSDSKTYTDRTRHLWVEYLRAFHGTQQCRWSNGLKKSLLIEEVTDEEACETVDSTPVCVITRRQYHVLTVLKKRAFILNVADICPSSTVIGIILDLESAWLDAQYSENLTEFISVNSL